MNNTDVGTWDWLVTESSYNLACKNWPINVVQSFCGATDRAFKVLTAPKFVKYRKLPITGMKLGEYLIKVTVFNVESENT